MASMTGGFRLMVDVQSQLLPWPSNSTRRRVDSSRASSGHLAGSSLDVHLERTSGVGRTVSGPRARVSAYPRAYPQRLAASLSAE